MKPADRPPRLLEWMLEKWSVYNDDFNCTGDFREEFARRSLSGGKSRARRWYLRQVLLTMLTNAGVALSRFLDLVNGEMKTSMRNLLRHKTYSFINIAGLALGMSGCLMIFVWIQDEISFDRFHENAPRLFKVGRVSLDPSTDFQSYRTPIPLSYALEQEVPEVEKSLIFDKTPRFVRIGSNFFTDIELVYTEPEIFDLFTLPLLSGSRESALASLSSIVLTRETAVKFFGNVNPIGRVVSVGEGRDHIVSGVIENIPRRSHLRFDGMVPFDSRSEKVKTFIRKDDWKISSVENYVLLRSPDTAAIARNKAIEIYKRHRPETTSTLSFQPITEIHLHPYGGEGGTRFLFLFSALAVFVLVIAGINFTNLSTARAGLRSREIAVRKVVGAGRGDIIRQFMGESVLFSAIASSTAVLIALLMLPLFNSLSGKQLYPEDLARPDILLGLVVITLAAAFLAGIYPAAVLSAFRPAGIFRGAAPAGRTGGVRFRRFLVIFQFAVSIFLIIGAVVIHNQLHFMNNRDLGFDRSNLVYFPAAGIFKNSFETARLELLGHPAVTGVSKGNPPVMFDMITDEVGWEGQTADAEVTFLMTSVGFHYLETMGIELVEGRPFSRDSLADLENALILNQEAVRAMGVGSPVGMRVTRRLFDHGDWLETEERVIGVVRDFHAESFHRRIQPVIIDLDPENAYMVCVRIAPGRLSEAMDFLRDTWRENVPDQPFHFTFLDETLESFYISEKRMGSLFNVFTGLAVMVACLGLFGLASYTAERRRKEIGIRKILGASDRGIVLLMTGGMLKLVLAAGVPAWPLSWFAVRGWLNGFAYRASVRIEIFLLSTLAAAFLALLTVSALAVRSARADPSRTLRYE